MKWIVRLSIAVLILLAGGAGLAYWSALRSANPVGFRLAQAAKNGDAPLVVAIWYPTSARAWPTVLFGPVLMDVAKDAPVEGQGLPLIVLSHGNGGGPQSHADLALALADGAGSPCPKPKPTPSSTSSPSLCARPPFHESARFLFPLRDFGLSLCPPTSRSTAVRRVPASRLRPLEARTTFDATAAGARPGAALHGARRASTRFLEADARAGSESGRGLFG